MLIERDKFPEDFARFYIAEMVLAIEEAHRLGYIHRCATALRLAIALQELMRCAGTSR